jgi:hypothetical protein
MEEVEIAVQFVKASSAIEQLKKKFTENQNMTLLFSPVCAVHVDEFRLSRISRDYLCRNWPNKNSQHACKPGDVCTFLDAYLGYCPNPLNELQALTTAFSSLLENMNTSAVSETYSTLSIANLRKQHEWSLRNPHR